MLCAKLLPVMETVPLATEMPVPSIACPPRVSESETTRASPDKGHTRLYRSAERHTMAASCLRAHR